MQSLFSVWSCEITLSLYFSMPPFARWSYSTFLNTVKKPLETIMTSQSTYYLNQRILRDQALSSKSYFICKRGNKSALSSKPFSPVLFLITSGTWLNWELGKRNQRAQERIVRSCSLPRRLVQVGVPSQEAWEEAVGSSSSATRIPLGVE